MPRPQLLLAAVLVLCTGAAFAQSAPQGKAERGKHIFASYGCYQCHGYQGQGSNAGSRLAPDPLPYPAFASLVRQPRPRMPPYSLEILSDQDMADIHAYLVTIPKARTVAETPLLGATPSGATAAPPTAIVPQNATEKAALEIMEKMGWGTNAATRALDEDLWHIINQANLGLIWTRPGLNLRERELIVMAVLVAIGSPGVSHLMQHADAVGITDAEIKELILQTLPYSGQPNAIQAILALKRVQAERQTSESR